MTELATLNGHIDSVRLPPQSREAERGVIGSALRDNSSLAKILQTLRVEHFYYDAHQKVFRAIADLYSAGKPVDLLILHETLKQRQHLEDVGGVAYLGDLWDAAPTAANANYYAGIVRDKANARRLIHLSTEAIRDAYDGVASTEDILAQFTSEVANLAKADRPSRFAFVPSDAFAQSDYAPQWLIPRTLVLGQPGIVAGPRKGMKTSLMVDLAVSLASATPFLGEFPVPHPARVAVVSGESGFATLQETARRVCVAKGVKLSDLGSRLTWCKDLPTLTNLAVMHEFASTLAKLGVDVVLIDPLYLCMGDVDAKNLFEMGSALRTVSELLLGQGITPIVAHHANRQLPIGEAMELHHLAYSGVEQFARQFLLINRRKPYQSDGTHDLWVRIGGSAGHGGLWSVHVQEGVADEHFGGRTWDVSVASVSEVKDEIEAEKCHNKSDRERVKAQQARKERHAQQLEIMALIDDLKSKGQDAVTVNDIKDLTSVPDHKVNDLLKSLVEDGTIRKVKFVKMTGKGNKTPTQLDGYARIKSEE